MPDAPPLILTRRSVAERVPLEAMKRGNCLQPVPEHLGPAVRAIWEAVAVEAEEGKDVS